MSLDQEILADHAASLQPRNVPDPEPLVRHAWEAFHSREWSEAGCRWATLRKQFPNLLIGYAAAITTLREAGRFEAAGAMAEETLQRFPNDAPAYAEEAWLAAARGDNVAAAALWTAMRDRFPNEWVAFFGGARASRELGDAAGAEALLAAGIARFPSQPTLLSEFASAAVKREDWSEANHRWARVRAEFPGQVTSYISGARALRETGRFDEAEALLQDADRAFPAETAPATELAWLALVRRDFVESARRWETVRRRFSVLISGYVNSVHPLRALNRLGEAEQILIEAVLRFPNEFAPALELASVARHRGDWSRADRLFAILRERFPDQAASHSGSILALRELHRFDDAEAVGAAAIARFPLDQGLRIDMAWLAQAARNLNAAIDRWAEVRRVRPDFQAAYIHAARALRDAWRHDEAESLLQEAMWRFPLDAEPAAQHAWLALHQNRPDEARDRFKRLRDRFPSSPDGWQGGAAVLRNQFQFGAAEALLEQAIAGFPGVPQFLLDHAQLPVAPHFAHEKNWPETLARLARLHALFPSFEAGLIGGVRALKDARQPAEAEALAQLASERLPDCYALAVQFAEAAEERRDWPQAVERYSRIRVRFSHLAGGDVGLARAFAGCGRFAEAEAMLRDATIRFPLQPAPFAEYAEFATRREKWAEALERWIVARDRFPQEQDFAHRGYEARMRLADADPMAAVALAQLAPAPMPDPESTDQQVSELAMQFESLGGRGLGCEFGIFQRYCGAEPLGLLRWADMTHERLLFALRSRFDGVGLEEHTELFVSAVGGGRGEYCTRDRRGMMFMRTFVYEDQAPMEKMKVSAFNRLRFLTRKLIEDLELGSKIFIFRITDRNLTMDEVNALHAAMRAYGENTLLYVRYEDEDHPNGTVEVAGPGLMVGYMDRFKLSVTNQLSATPPTASWLEVCRNAYVLWQSTRVG